jgi:deoxyribodipyrimidine photo-lyase
MPVHERSLCWFRRDLRNFDHAALHRALSESRKVFCAFVFDREILDPLQDRADRRVEFIRDSLAEVDAALRNRGGGMIVLHDIARDAIPRIARQLRVAAVYANRDYEPAAIARDAYVAQALESADIAFVTTKDQVIFEQAEILSQSRKPLVVFTPYKKSWLNALTPADLAPHAVEQRGDGLAPPPSAFTSKLPPLEAIGFRPTNLRAVGLTPGMAGGAKRFADFRKRIDRYDDARDYPAAKGPSYLSVDLRFGTVSIRQLAAFAHARSLDAGGEGAQTWLSELIWRDFYAQVLWHHPHAAQHAFRREYEALPFRNDASHFEAWCSGRTGYPLVDAAMRQLNQTGYMHNRLRMVTASFLVKDLLIDWRWGERYFAAKLNDYDLASNNGGWQWAASTGCDAQPYFRIFNPVTQSERFDAQGKFIRRYVPELKSLSAKEIHAPWKLPADTQRQRGVVVGHEYPSPVVDHDVARHEALALFKSARASPAS